ncbi:MAG: glycoside hydrolase family 3 C-terminal domain-containing protein, partial [Bifidobacteriaceae bacterium]|nr:glycoside hydrolase family 3 C-terminal domain-containing protein [Bifidobacteriaceae bacterium]
TGPIQASYTRVPGLAPNDPAYNDLGIATELPTGLAIGSTWDPDALELANSYVGNEARAYYNFRNKGLTWWSPTVNLDRDPRWGRADETYGEDPVLTASIGGAFVIGLQDGEGTGFLKSVATPKHFFANDSDGTRNHQTSNLTERSLREYYTAQFAELYGKYEAKSGMTSYNANAWDEDSYAKGGIPSPANKFAQETLARRTWGFDGFITSDCGAITNVFNTHHFVDNRAQATAISLKAGTDVDCTAGSQYSAGVFEAVQQGILTEDQIDINLVRVFKVRFELGEFDDPSVLPWSDETNPEYNHAAIATNTAHAAAAKTLSDAAPVLLKNAGGVLPVPASGSPKIVVTGYLGGEEVHGDYSPYLTPKSVVGISESPYAGLARKYGAQNVTYIPGLASDDVTVGHPGDPTKGIDPIPSTPVNWNGIWNGLDPTLVSAAPGSDPRDYSPFAPTEWGQNIASNPSLANAVDNTSTATTRAGRIVYLQKPSLGNATDGLIQFIASSTTGQTALGNPVAAGQIKDEDIAGWRGRGNRITQPASWTDNSIWGGQFAVDVEIDAAANAIKLAQGGTQPSTLDPAAPNYSATNATTAPTSTAANLLVLDTQGYFTVHVGSATGPQAAMIPAAGVTATVPYTGPTGKQRLYFVYHNDAYKAADFASPLYEDPAAPGAYHSAAWFIKNADLVVNVVGTRSRESTEGLDRSSLDLARNQDGLVNAVTAVRTADLSANPAYTDLSPAQAAPKPANSVAWLVGVEQNNVEPFKNNVPAIVWTSYNGQSQGDSMADILAGDVNPSGHLPMTWYTDVDQLPNILDYTLTPEADHEGRTYQYFTGDVTYPFGHGLSYSNFTVANAALSATTAAPGGTVNVSVDVTGAGPAGKAVVQLYATSPQYSAANPDKRPIRQLKAFKKVDVAAGATQTVTLPLAVSDLWFWDDAADRRTYDTGAWQLSVGLSSDPADGLPLTLNVSGALGEQIDQVVAIPDGVTLDTRAPDKAIHANLSVTRADQSFFAIPTAGLAISYESLNPAVASVDSSGTVRPVGAGATQIRATATLAGHSESTTFPVIVIADNPAPFPKPVVQLPDVTVELSAARAGVQLGASVVPAVAGATSVYSLAWQEDNGAAAAVTDDGVFTASQIGATRVAAAVTVPGFRAPGVDPTLSTDRTVTVEANVTVIADGARPSTPARETARDAVTTGIVQGHYNQHVYTPASWAALSGAIA